MAFSSAHTLSYIYSHHLPPLDSSQKKLNCVWDIGLNSPFDIFFQHCCFHCHTLTQEEPLLIAAYFLVPKLFSKEKPCLFDYFLDCRLNLQAYFLQLLDVVIIHLLKVLTLGLLSNIRWWYILNLMNKKEECSDKSLSVFLCKAT